MSFSLIYILHRLAYRFADFFHHWYIDASRYFLHHLTTSLANLDMTFAVKATLRHFFEPLYGDYSPVGRVIGFIFRTIRVTLGVCVYAVWAILWGVAFGVWLALPLIIILYVLRSIFTI